jgi:hypothetical protein
MCRDVCIARWVTRNGLGFFAPVARQRAYTDRGMRWLSQSDLSSRQSLHFPCLTDFFRMLALILFESRIPLK